ncbi:MAG: hypothetical protein ACLP00_12170 [Terracidiphilus sp.]
MLLVTVFPFVSSTVTTGCVANVLPEDTLPTGSVVKTSCVAAPAENTMLPLVTGVRAVSPAVAVAVSMVSAFEYTGVDIVTQLLLVLVVPVSVPLSVPPPEALLSVIVVLLVGL